MESFESLSQNLCEALSLTTHTVALCRNSLGLWYPFPTITVDWQVAYPRGGPTQFQLWNMDDKGYLNDNVFCFFLRLSKWFLRRVISGTIISNLGIRLLSLAINSHLATWEHCCPVWSLDLFWPWSICPPLICLSSPMWVSVFAAQSILWHDSLIFTSV